MVDLDEVLAWVGSHSKRLSRAGMHIPNPLNNGTITFYEPKTEIPLDSMGRLNTKQDLSKFTRLEIRSASKELLYVDHG